MLTEWTITEDKVAFPDAKPGTNGNAVGMVGPRGAKLSSDEIKNHKDAIKFRMKDDDDEICYVGYVILGDEGYERELAPLDDFGSPNAGCTAIELFHNHEWKLI